MTTNQGSMQGSLADNEFDCLDEVNNCAYFVASRSKTILALIRLQNAADFDEKTFVDFYFHINELNEKGEALARWAMNCIGMQHFPGTNELNEMKSFVTKLQKNLIEAEHRYDMLTAAGRPLGSREDMDKMFATMNVSLQGIKEEIVSAKKFVEKP